jgi:hypothetical protein
MRVLHSYRKRPQWLRVLLVGLLFAFALDCLADVSHQHNTATTQVHLCSYCATFGSLGGVPPDSVSIATFTRIARVTVVAGVDASPRRHSSHAQPRAPPLFLKP